MRKFLANAALGEGVETHLFFTFWGFDMINKKTMGDLKFTMLGNTATHMPMGLTPFPGVTGMASRIASRSFFMPVHNWSACASEAASETSYPSVSRRLFRP